MVLPAELELDEVAAAAGEVPLAEMAVGAGVAAAAADNAEAADVSSALEA